LLKFRLPGPSQRISMNHWLSVTSRMCVGAVFLGFAVFTNATDRHDHRSRAGAWPHYQSPNRDSRPLFTVPVRIVVFTVHRCAFGWARRPCTTRQAPTGRIHLTCIVQRPPWCWFRRRLRQFM
jgi:hypothetical protein